MVPGQMLPALCSRTRREHAPVKLGVAECSVSPRKEQARKGGTSGLLGMAQTCQGLGRGLTPLPLDPRTEPEGQSQLCSIHHTAQMLPGTTASSTLQTAAFSAHSDTVCQQTDRRTDGWFAPSDLGAPLPPVNGECQTGHHRVMMRMPPGCEGHGAAPHSV